MSAFTALNGGSPKTSETSPAPQERSAHQNERAQTSVAQAQDNVEPTSENWTERQALPSSAYPEGEPSQKRKRSDSVELRREAIIQERTPETATVPTQGDSRGQFDTSQRDRDSWLSHTGREDRGVYESLHSTRASSHGQAEDPTGESFRGSTHGEHEDYDHPSPDGDDRSVGPYGYTSEHRSSDSILRHDPKKRKRNFSNRTKTGCMTCRRRKKKCDETKPECTNCVKGGFVCAGYPAQKGTTWQSKPDNKASTVPLESKDPTYVPPGAYGMPSAQQPQPQQQQPQPPPPPPSQSQPQTSYNPQSGKREPLPHYRGQALRIDPPQGRPLTTDDDRPTASTAITSASGASPDNKLSALSSHTLGNPFPTPISANTQQPFSDRMSKEYGRVPPLHDLSRNEPETPLSGQLPQFKFSQPSRNNSPSSAQQKQHPGPNPQAAARMALSHPAFPPRRTQKEEMLSGRSYYPFDEELVLERERCASACWRFNNITIPSHGVSGAERINLFSQILNPREPVRPVHSDPSPIAKSGRVGDEVTVEAPFNCDYGYNITIGKLVSVGRDCHFNDVRDVTIGDNCVIGPGVKLYTAKAPIDPKRRQGSRGPQSGESIVIEPDCWIGGGAIILPGVKIGRESTVGAGSVVTRDVPPRTVVAGNPARVIRGVGE